MIKISAIIIAKDEQDVISDCIDSVSFCDEIVVINNGSSDKTAEISQKMGANVYTYTSKDFSKLRNIGLEKSKGEWILYIDADERVGNELIKSIQTVIEEDREDIGIYKVKRKNFYLGKHEWPYTEKMERLFRRKDIKGWHGILHETPIIEGKVGILDGSLLHYTHRDLKTMLEKTIAWSSVEAQLRFDAHHPQMSWWRFPRVMISGFFDSYIKQKGYKAGSVGLIESMYQSFSMFITYAKLWELQHKNK